MIFEGSRYSFRAGFSLRVENFYIETGLAELGSPESICLAVKSSVIFSIGCFVVKAFAFQRLKFRLHFMAYFVLFQQFRLYFNIMSYIMAYFVLQRYREFHDVIGECIHLWDGVESGWISVNGSLHGHVVGCLVVPIHISDVIHL